MLSHVQLFATPWTAAHQAPLSMGILQANILEGSPCPPPGHLPNLGIEPRSPTLEADSLPVEPLGKPKNTEVCSLSLLQRIFPSQESNQGLPHCGQIFYQPSYKGSPLCVCKVGTYTDDLPTMGEHWPGTGKLEAKETEFSACNRVGRHCKGGNSQCVILN